MENSAAVGAKQPVGGAGRRSLQSRFRDRSMTSVSAASTSTFSPKNRASLKRLGSLPESKIPEERRLAGMDKGTSVPAMLRLPPGVFCATTCSAQASGNGNNTLHSPEPTHGLHSPDGMVPAVNPTLGQCQSYPQMARGGVPLAGGDLDTSGRSGRSSTTTGSRGGGGGGGGGGTSRKRSLASMPSPSHIRRTMSIIGRSASRIASGAMTPVRRRRHRKDANSSGDSGGGDGGSVAGRDGFGRGDVRERFSGGHGRGGGDGGSGHRMAERDGGRSAAVGVDGYDSPVQTGGVSPEDDSPATVAATAAAAVTGIANAELIVGEGGRGHNRPAGVTEGSANGDVSTGVQSAAIGVEGVEGSGAHAFVTGPVRSYKDGVVLRQEFRVSSPRQNLKKSAQPEESVSWVWGQKEKAEVDVTGQGTLRRKNDGKVWKDRTVRRSLSRDGRRTLKVGPGRASPPLQSDLNPLAARVPEPPQASESRVAVSSSPAVATPSPAVSTTSTVPIASGASSSSSPPGTPTSQASSAVSGSSRSSVARGRSFFGTGTGGVATMFASSPRGARAARRARSFSHHNITPSVWAASQVNTKQARSAATTAAVATAPADPNNDATMIIEPAISRTVGDTDGMPPPRPSMAVADGCGVGGRPLSTGSILRPSRVFSPGIGNRRPSVSFVEEAELMGIREGGRQSQSPPSLNAKAPPLLQVDPTEAFVSLAAADATRVASAAGPASVAVPATVGIRVPRARVASPSVPVPATSKSLPIPVLTRSALQQGVSSGDTKRPSDLNNDSGERDRDCAAESSSSDVSSGASWLSFRRKDRKVGKGRGLSASKSIDSASLSRLRGRLGGRAASGRAARPGSPVSFLNDKELFHSARSANSASSVLSGSSRHSGAESELSISGSSDSNSNSHSRANRRLFAERRRAALVAASRQLMPNSKQDSIWNVRAESVATALSKDVPVSPLPSMHSTMSDTLPAKDPLSLVHGSSDDGSKLGVWARPVSTRNAGSTTTLLAVAGGGSMPLVPHAVRPRLRSAESSSSAGLSSSDVSSPAEQQLQKQSTSPSRLIGSGGLRRVVGYSRAATMASLPPTRQENEARDNPPTISGRAQRVSGFVRAANMASPAPMKEKEEAHDRLPPTVEKVVLFRREGLPSESCHVAAAGGPPARATVITNSFPRYPPASNSNTSSTMMSNAGATINSSGVHCSSASIASGDRSSLLPSGRDRMATRADGKGSHAGDDINEKVHEGSALDKSSTVVPYTSPLVDLRSGAGDGGNCDDRKGDGEEESSAKSEDACLGMPPVDDLPPAEIGALGSSLSCALCGAAERPPTKFSTSRTPPGGIVWAREVVHRATSTTGGGASSLAELEFQRCSRCRRGCCGDCFRWLPVYCRGPRIIVPVCRDCFRAVDFENRWHNHLVVTNRDRARKTLGPSEHISADRVCPRGAGGGRAAADEGTDTRSKLFPDRLFMSTGGKTSSSATANGLRVSAARFLRRSLSNGGDAASSGSDGAFTDTAGAASPVVAITGEGAETAVAATSVGEDRPLSLPLMRGDRFASSTGVGVRDIYLGLTRPLLGSRAYSTSLDTRQGTNGSPPGRVSAAAGVMSGFAAAFSATRASPVPPHRHPSEEGMHPLSTGSTASTSSSTSVGVAGSPAPPRKPLYNGPPAITTTLDFFGSISIVTGRMSPNHQRGNPPSECPCGAAALYCEVLGGDGTTAAAAAGGDSAVAAVTAAAAAAEESKVAARKLVRAKAYAHLLTRGAKAVAYAKLQAKAFEFLRAKATEAVLAPPMSATQAAAANAHRRRGFTRSQSLPVSSGNGGDPDIEGAGVVRAKLLSAEAPVTVPLPITQARKSVPPQPIALGTEDAVDASTTCGVGRKGEEGDGEGERGVMAGGGGILSCGLRPKKPNNANNVCDPSLRRESPTIKRTMSSLPEGLYDDVDVLLPAPLATPISAAAMTTTRATAVAAAAAAAARLSGAEVASPTIHQVLIASAPSPTEADLTPPSPTALAPPAPTLHAPVPPGRQTPSPQISPQVPGGAPDVVEGLFIAGAGGEETDDVEDYTTRQRQKQYEQDDNKRRDQRRMDVMIQNLRKARELGSNTGFIKDTTDTNVSCEEARASGQTERTEADGDESDTEENNTEVTETESHITSPTPEISVDCPDGERWRAGTGSGSIFGSAMGRRVAAQARVGAGCVQTGDISKLLAGYGNQTGDEMLQLVKDREALFEKMLSGDGITATKYPRRGKPRTVVLTLVVPGGDPVASADPLSTSFVSSAGYHSAYNSQSTVEDIFASGCGRPTSMVRVQPRSLESLTHLELVWNRQRGGRGSLRVGEVVEALAGLQSHVLRPVVEDLKKRASTNGGELGGMGTAGGEEDTYGSLLTQRRSLDLKFSTALTRDRFLSAFKTFAWETAMSNSGGIKPPEVLRHYARNCIENPTP